MASPTSSDRQPDGVDVAVGARVRVRRMEMSITQAGLASAVGISVQQIQKYENGKNRISASRLSYIATALQTSPAALIGGNTQAGLDGELLGTPGAIVLLKAYAAVVSPAHRKGLIAMALALGPDGTK